MVKIKNNYVYGVIYKIINKINNKIYIGQTTEKNGVSGRYRGNNIEKYTNNKHLKNSINKYGIENFKIIDCIDIANNKEELDNKEIYWIEYYQSYDSNYGYNKQKGGYNGTPNEETKKKMSDNNWLKNGGIPWNKGKKNVYSAETLQKMSDNHADFNRGNHPRAIKVICTTTNMIFDCIRSAAIFYKCDESSILKCCKGTQKTCGKLNNNNIKLEWSFVN